MSELCRGESCKTRLPIFGLPFQVRRQAPRRRKRERAEHCTVAQTNPQDLDFEAALLARKNPSLPPQQTDFLPVESAMLHNYKGPGACPPEIRPSQLKGSPSYVPRLAGNRLES